MTIGFSGTRAGMTAAQREKVAALVEVLKSRGCTEARHGVCKGADDDFHVIAKAAGLHTIGHPGVNMFGRCPSRGVAECDVVLKAKAFLVRDHDIVDGSDFMIATPKTQHEEFRGSGTWAAIRYAKQSRRILYVVYPDGEIAGFNQ